MTFSGAPNLHPLVRKFPVQKFSGSNTERRVFFGNTPPSQDRPDTPNTLSPLPQDVLDILDRETESPPETESPEQSGAVLSPKRREALLAELAKFEQERYVPENNKPPERPVGVKGHRLIRLPEEYASTHTQHVTEVPPLSLPTLKEIEDISADAPLRFTVPIQQPDRFSVVENSSAWMNLQEDTQAQRLVRGGLQPSMIGKNWKALWSKEKVARDMLQNFSDGHNGTLEGTSIEISREEINGDSGTGKFRVRLTGLGQYDYEKAYLLGGTSKADDKTKAGNYGEGLKVMSLNLLRDYGADFVRMASANWEMSYTMPEAQTGEPKMFRHLKELKTPQEGNILEFTTDSTDLLAQLFQSIHYFYHPYNSDFTGTVIETPYGGMAIYDSKYNAKHGNVYIAGQRFALGREDNWEGTLPGMSIWTREKSLDKGRDRSAVHHEEVRAIVANIIEKLPDEDLVYALTCLEPRWQAEDNYGYSSDKKNLLPAVIAHLVAQMKARKLAMPFDTKYYAGSRYDLRSNIQYCLEAIGHKVCPKQFKQIGMTPLEAWHLYFANFQMIEPTPAEKLQIEILHKLMLDLVTAFQETSGSESSPISNTSVLKPIYIYDQESQTGPDKLVQGRARYNAIWLASGLLNLPLAKVLSIYAHELMHCHGDDGTEEFSKAFDIYIQRFMGAAFRSPDFARQFQECEILWNESLPTPTTPDPPPEVPSPDAQPPETDTQALKKTDDTGGLFENVRETLERLFPNGLNNKPFVYRKLRDETGEKLLEEEPFREFIQTLPNAALRRMFR